MNTERINRDPYQLDLFDTSRAKTHRKSVYPVDTTEEKKSSTHSLTNFQDSEIIVKRLPTNKLH